MIQNSKKNLKTIPIIICIDVEPDGFQIDKYSKVPWLGFEKYFEFSKTLRLSLQKQTQESVNFAWFYRIDPQVKDTYGDESWALLNYRSILDELIAEGDEIGVHPHSFRWVPNKNHWISDHADQSWVEHCIQVSVEGYKKVLGVKPQSHRFGATWMNNRTMQYIEELGFKYDLTLEPGYGKDCDYDKAQKPTGEFADLRKVPQYPYRCMTNDFSKVDRFKRTGLWVLPMSTGLCRYNFGRLEKIKKLFLNPSLLKPFRMSLHVALRRTRFIEEVVNSLLVNLKRPYLSLIIRSDCGIKQDYMKRIAENIEFLMSHPMSDQFIFCTPQQAMRILGYETQV